MQEIELIAEADKRARDYLSGIEARPPFPDHAARDGLAVFAEALAVALEFVGQRGIVRQMLACGSVVHPTRKYTRMHRQVSVLTEFC